MMPLWTCPNPKCTYDKRIEPGQRCPLCGEEAKALNSSEFGAILKEKGALKKLEAGSSQRGEAYGRTKFCPKCGSTNITFPVFYRPSIWRCLDCGYEGALIVEDGKVAEKIQERYQRKKRKNRDSTLRA
jgi:RNA polymerase subunit RPABC4/transcription elongation factor Spt4